MAFVFVSGCVLVYLCLCLSLCYSEQMLQLSLWPVDDHRSSSALAPSTWLACSLAYFHILCFVKVLRYKIFSLCHGKISHLLCVFQDTEYIFFIHILVCENFPNNPFQECLIVPTKVPKAPKTGQKTPKVPKSAHSAQKYLKGL